MSSINEECSNHSRDWRLTIVDKYDEVEIYSDNYYYRFFTGDFLNQMAMVYGGISFSQY